MSNQIVGSQTHRVLLQDELAVPPTPSPRALIRLAMFRCQLRKSAPRVRPHFVTIASRSAAVSEGRLWPSEWQLCNYAFFTEFWLRVCQNVALRSRYRARIARNANALAAVSHPISPRLDNGSSPADSASPIFKAKVCQVGVFKLKRGKPSEIPASSARYQ